jgi:hypothetical protein
MQQEAFDEGEHLSAIGARKRLSGGCVPSRDARQARRRLRYCACAAIIPSCRNASRGGSVFFHTPLWRTVADTRPNSISSPNFGQSAERHRGHSSYPCDPETSGMTHFRAPRTTYSSLPPCPNNVKMIDVNLLYRRRPPERDGFGPNHIVWPAKR